MNCAVTPCASLYARSKTSCAFCRSTPIKSPPPSPQTRRMRRRNRAQCPAQNSRSLSRENKQLCASVCVSELVRRPGEDNRRRPAELLGQERVCERARSIVAIVLPKCRPEHRQPVAPIRRAAVAFSFLRRCRVRLIRSRSRVASRCRVRVFENLKLGSCDIVFGQLTDFLEQLRTALVVEKFAG